MKRNTIKLLQVSLILASCLVCTESVKAQSISDLFKTVTKTATKSSNTLDLAGTWNYEGASVELESGNVLKQLGGKVASSTMEKNINQQLEKVGLKAGATNFTFATDSTFTNTTNKKTLKGTYSYNKKTEYLTLNYATKVPVKMKVTGSGSDLSFLFDADELLSVIGFVGNNAKSASVKNLATILNSYDGLKIGLKMNKTK